MPYWVSIFPQRLSHYKHGAAGIWLCIQLVIIDCYYTV